MAPNFKEVKNMIRVLALDIAQNRTGWARAGSDAASRPRWGVFETINWANKQGGNLVRFKDFLHEFDGDGITHVVCEDIFVDVRNGGKQFQFNGTEGQMMLCGAVLEWAERQSIPQFKINIGDWRQRFLGIKVRPKDAKGDDMYWKNLALKVAAQRGWFCEFHDSAEALGMADYALAQLDLAYRDRTNVHLNRQHVDQIQGRGLHAR
jgi:hypothetical protein